MGLVVSPIYHEDQLIALTVSCESGCEIAAETGVVLPVEGAQIVENIGTAKGDRPNVVDFPAER